MSPSVEDLRGPHLAEQGDLAIPSLTRVMTPIRRNRTRRPAVLAAFLLVVEFCGGVPSGWADPLAACAPGEPITPASRPAQQESLGIDSPMPVFELHSGFWVNLHHFLYLQARLMKGDPSLTDTGRGAAPPLFLPHRRESLLRIFLGQ